MKTIGRISRVELGFGGNYNSELGIYIEIEAKDTEGTVLWAKSFFSGNNTYTKDLDTSISVIQSFYDTVKILEDAQVQYISELINKAVVCEFDDIGKIRSWKIMSMIY